MEVVLTGDLLTYELLTDGDLLTYELLTNTWVMDTTLYIDDGH